jgi:hypothetical protein
MRNIRDFKAQIRPGKISPGAASPFDIISESFRLADFTKAEIKALYSQHTEASGQIFDPSAIDMAWDWSGGQPWLVNALARDVVDRQLDNDFSVVISGTHLDQAAESLIQRRDVHIDSLLERLKEPRVIKVMDSVFAGTKSQIPVASDDRQYCLDLGLAVKNADQKLRPANRLYQEAFSRAIIDEINFVLDINKDKRIFTDGKVLFITNILKEFQMFWKHNSGYLYCRFNDLAAFKYDKAAYTFMLLSFMQKAVGREGGICRQFAEDCGAANTAVIYKEQEYSVGVKLGEASFSLEESLKQLAGHLEAAGEKEGWLVVFDPDLSKSWEEKIYWKTEQAGSLTVHAAGC